MYQYPDTEIPQLPSGLAGNKVLQPSRDTDSKHIEEHYPVSRKDRRLESPEVLGLLSLHNLLLPSGLPDLRHLS